MNNDKYYLYEGHFLCEMTIDAGYVKPLLCLLLTQVAI
jgi:hypothetical protein